jgi:phosphate transport system permease protein
MTVIDQPTAESPDLGPGSPPRTTLPVRTPLERSESPRCRRLGGASLNGVLCVIGAAAASLCGSLLLFGRLAPFSGLIAFVAVTYALFLLIYAALISLSEDGPAVTDRVMTAVLYSAFMVTFTALVSIAVYIGFRGWPAIHHVNFYTQDMSVTGPLDPLTKGGIKHALVGTLWMIAIALVITVPLAIVGAVYLSEARTPFSRFIRTIVDAMTALPSIVAGLFIYGVWIVSLHHEKSGFAASLALSIMMLPIIVRASDVVLRLVPGNLKEASFALGAPRWRTMWHVTLPTARSGLATAVILGTARGLGETSPVLLTAGFTQEFNSNPAHGPMVSLPLFVFKEVGSPEPGPKARAFGAALVLLALVVILFFIARIIGGRGPGFVSKRKARRMAHKSARDLARFQTEGEDVSTSAGFGVMRSMPGVLGRRQRRRGSPPTLPSESEGATS